MANETGKDENDDQMAVNSEVMTVPKSWDEQGFVNHSDEKTKRQIENNFKYHAPKAGQPEIYTALRAKAKELADFINYVCPSSREKSLALTELESSVMWANSAIARAE